MTSHPLSSSLSTTLSTLSSSPKPTLYYYRCSLPSSTSSATSWTHFQTKLVVELSDYIPEEDPQKETEKEKEKENEDVRFETLSSIHHPPLALDRTHPLNEKKRNKRRSSTSTKTKIPTEKEKKASIPFPWSSSSRRRYLKKNELDSFHLMPRNGSILVKIRINCNEVLGHQVDSLKQHIHDQVSTSMLQFLHHGVHSIVHLPETTSPAEFEPSSLSTSCDSFVNLTTTSPSKRSHKKNKNSESMVYSNTFKFHFHSSMHWIAPFTPPSPHRATTSSSCHQMKPLYLSYLQVHSLTLHIQVNFQGPSSLPAPAPAPTPLHRRVPLSYFMLDPCSFQHDWQPYFLNLIHQCCWLLPSLFSTKYVQVILYIVLPIMYLLF
ncbi:hypothetical protein HMI56_000149 [Coelomomyces lativittatus]|nr:hypothetical protein HMI56_000149 [Coelomomyces lativittatus]